MSLSTPDVFDPVADKPVSEGHARSPQCPLPRRVLHDDATTIDVKYLDLRLWAGSLVEVSSNDEFFVLAAISTTPPDDPAPGNTTTTTTTAGDPDVTAPAADVMARYAADTVVRMVVNPKRPFLAYATTLAAQDLWVVRR